MRGRRGGALGWIGATWGLATSAWAQEGAALPTATSAAAAAVGAPAEGDPVQASPPPPVIAAPAKPTKVPPNVEVAAGKGLTVSSADGKNAFTVRARFVPRFDASFVGAGDAPTTRASIATARLWFQGHVFDPKFTWLVQLAVAGKDFRDGATSPIFDAYVDYKVHRDASVKVGQYFVPFDRLRTVREFALQMTDRPRPVGELTLDRDVGVTVYSDHLGADRSPLAYRVGVFGGGGTNLTSSKPAGALFVGRLELRPFGDVDDDSEGDLENRAKPGLALGGGVAYNLNTNRQKSTTGTTVTAGTIDYLHAAADLVFKWHGVAVQGEYVRRQAAEDTLVLLSDDGSVTEQWARSGHGWVAQLSYHAPFGVEWVARGSQMGALGETDPAFVSELQGKRNEVAAGLNWYRNGHRFKVQTTWQAIFGDDFAAATHTLATQLDVMF